MVVKDGEDGLFVSVFVPASFREGDDVVDGSGIPTGVGGGRLCGALPEGAPGRASVSISEGLRSEGDGDEAFADGSDPSSSLPLPVTLAWLGGGLSDPPGGLLLLWWLPWLWVVCEPPSPVGVSLACSGCSTTEGDGGRALSAPLSSALPRGDGGEVWFRDPVAGSRK